jgi:hypothetical protein
MSHGYHNDRFNIRTYLDVTDIVVKCPTYVNIKVTDLVVTGPKYINI